MKSAALFASLLLTLGAALASVGAAAPAEPPALTAKQLQSRSTLIVIATVTEVWSTKVGRETRFQADLRVHKVEQAPKDKQKARDDAKTRQAEKKEEKAKPKLQDEKLKLRDPKEQDELEEKAPDPAKLSEQDKVKTGDAITVTWVSRELKPGDKGSSGHAAHFVRPGQTVRVHMNDQNAVLAPNGIALADPVYAVEELLKSRDLTRLRDGATKATGIGAHDEAAKLWELAVAFQDLAAPDHRFYWASALAAGRRYVEAAQVLMPLALHPKDDSNAGKKKADAKRLVLAHLWACGDNQAYLAGFTQIAKTDNDAATWNALAEAANALHDSDTAKLAEAALVKLGPKTKPSADGRR